MERTERIRQTGSEREVVSLSASSASETPARIPKKKKRRYEHNGRKLNQNPKSRYPMAGEDVEQHQRSLVTTQSSSESSGFPKVVSSTIAATAPRIEKQEHCFNSSNGIDEEEELKEEQQQDCRLSIMAKVPIMKMKLRMMVIMLLFVVVVVIQKSVMTIPSSSTDADADDVSGWSLFTDRNDHHASFVCHSHQSITSSKRYDAPAAIPLCDDVIQALTDSFPGIDLQYADDVQQQKKKNLALFKGSRRQEASLSRRVLLSSVESESETMPDLSSCGEERNDNTWILTINILGSLFCISFMALASGLFLGFMTLDPLSLRIKIRASVDTEEREYCTKLLPVVENQHRLLVTLLIVDAIAYEALPLFV